MLDLLFWLIIFLVSLAVLIKASDWFTSSAEKIGVYFGLPAFIIGVTIVSFGTSLPELISSIYAVFAGSTEIVAANVIGSNIANIFLILGITVIIAKQLSTKFEIAHVDLPILMASAFLLTLLVWDGLFTIVDGLILLFALAIYIHYTISKKQKDTQVVLEKGITKKSADWKAGLILALSGILIYFGSKYTIESIIAISKITNIGTEVITVTAVALGTSLPELAVTIVAAKKGKSEMAIGNILGSNIFNTFAVMGIPALFGTLVITDSIRLFALPVMIMATILFFVMTQEKKITLWEGWLLILFYVFFVGKTFNVL